MCHTFLGHGAYTWSIRIYSHLDCIYEVIISTMVVVVVVVVSHHFGFHMFVLGPQPFLHQLQMECYSCVSMYVCMYVCTHNPRSLS